MASSIGPRELHNDALIIDGLIWHSDGNTRELREANVAALNLTVQFTDVEAGFETCLDDIATWLKAIEPADSGWRLVLDADDILSAQRENRIGVIMGWQNARALEDNLDRLILLHRLGLRVIQLTYNKRNFLADGCLEPEDGGLSAFGREAVRRMNEIGIAVDLSHCSDRTAIMAAEASSKPVLITHSCARAVANWERNRNDDAMKAVAITGGVVGVSIYGPIVWDGNPARRPSIDDFRRHLDHVVGLVGVRHVGLGTDQYQATDREAYCETLDVAQDNINPSAAAYSDAFGHTYITRYPSDCETIADYPRITEALVRDGWSEADIRAFLGENFLRAFRAIW